jgi:hypothetical protein
LIGCAPGKYKAKPDEEIYGTWTNPNTANQKVVISSDGTVKLFSSLGDTTPVSDRTFELVKKWKDADGNTWYHEDFRVLHGVYTYNGQQLDKIDKSGKVWEAIFIEVGKFDPNSYPTTLDPKSESYGIYYRSTN